MSRDRMSMSPQISTDKSDQDYFNVHIPPSMNSTILNMEGKGRMNKLDLLYKKFTDRILYAFSTEVLSKYFYTMDKTAIENANSQSTLYLRDQFNKIYESMKKEYQLEEKLNKLDEIIKDVDTTENPLTSSNMVPDPEQVARALKVKVKKQELERLWNIREELHGDITAKMDEINKKRAKIEEYKNKDINIKELLIDS